jgi:hypothetical protein
MRQITIGMNKKKGVPISLEMKIKEASMCRYEFLVNKINICSFKGISYKMAHLTHNYGKKVLHWLLEQMHILYITYLHVHKGSNITGCQHSCSAVVSFPVQEDTNQGSNPGGSQKPLVGNLKNSGRTPACGTCG